MLEAAALPTEPQQVPKNEKLTTMSNMLYGDGLFLFASRQVHLAHVFVLAVVVTADNFFLVLILARLTHATVLTDQRISSASLVR